MTHMPGIPVKFDDPDDWKPVIATWRCRKCKSPNGRYRTHTASDGGVQDDEVECKDCGHTYWHEGIDS